MEPELFNAFGHKSEFIKRFRQRRKEAGFTQKELAEKAKVSWSSLKRFELTGEISFSALVRLFYVLGYEADLDRLMDQTAYRTRDDLEKANQRYFRLLSGS